MIHFISGKPRSGKGLLTMELLYERLTTTENFIITNLALRMDELQRYLDEKGHSIHAVDRIRRLDDAQLASFFLHHEFHTLEKPVFLSTNLVANVDYSPIFSDERYYVGGKRFLDDGEPGTLKGVCYILDEVQNVFRAGQINKDWEHMVFYLTQHGKLNHTVLLVCQNTEHVYKQMRDLAQDFTYCRNHALEKFGVFRGEEKFTAKTYLSRLTNPGSQVASSSRTYRLNKKLAVCYDTSAGVGMPGGGRADARTKAKGVPIRSVLVLFALVGFGAWYLLGRVLPASVKNAVTPSNISKQGMIAIESAGVESTPKKADEVATQSNALPRYEHPPQPPSSGDPLWVRGYVSRGRLVQVVLSDGRTLTEMDRSLRSVDRAGAIVEGRRVYLQQVQDSGPRVVVEKPVDGGLLAGHIEQEPESSSWSVDKDGVRRIKKPDTLATMFKPVGR